MDVYRYSTQVEYSTYDTYNACIALQHVIKLHGTSIYIA